MSYVGMTATPVEEKPTVCKAALPAEQVKPPRLRSVVKALEVKATANLARAEKEVEKVERAAQTEGRAGRLVAAAAKLLGYEEILGRLCTPKDAELIRANVAYCEVAMGVDSDRPSKASGEMPMWLVMAVKAKVQVEVDGRLEPMNMMDAVVMKEAPLWIGAARKEVAGLVALECWDEVERSSVPSGRTIAPCHFVLKIKTEEVVDEKTGQASLRFVKCKARLCYGGHMSRYGEDYDQTAAFVCNPKTIRSMLALAAPREYKVCSWDVSQAFPRTHLSLSLITMRRIECTWSCHRSFASTDHELDPTVTRWSMRGAVGARTGRRWRSCLVICTGRKMRQESGRRLYRRFVSRSGRSR